VTPKLKLSKIFGQFVTEKNCFEIQDLAISAAYLKIWVSHGRNLGYILLLN
jgi:hypothetical protein